MSRWAISISLIVCFLASSSLAYAHTQPGPPYLMVNGQYAQTNVLISSSLVIPQDLTSQNYLVGTPVEFKVDLAQLQLPPLTIQSLKWRWEWGLKSSVFDDGVVVNHVFSKTGSYLVTLQVFDPINYPTKGYQDFDLVQINVVPHNPYILPGGTIKAEVNKSGDQVSITFTSTPVIDPSSSLREVSWDFSDGQIGSGATNTHSFKPFANAVFPMMRVTDSNGLFTDREIEVSSQGDITEIGTTNPSPASAKARGDNSNWNSILEAGGIAAGILIIEVSIYLYKKKRGRHVT